MNNFLRLFFVAVLGLVCNSVFADDKTDELTWEGLGLGGSNSSYAPFADITFNSSAVYAGTASSGTGKYIQLRSNKNDAGIVTTTSGGKLKSVTITFNEQTTDRAIDIYGKNEPYEVGPDMYDANKKGELIGSIAANGESFTLIPDVSYKYVGMVAHNGAIYIDKITVVWEEAQGETKIVTSVGLTGDYLTRFTPGKDGDETNLPSTIVTAGETAVEGAEVKWSLKMGDNWIMGEEEPSIGDGKIYIPNHSCGDLTITAKYEGNDQYEGSSKSYTMKVYKGYLRIQSILEDFPEVGGDSWKEKEAEWNKGYLTSYWQVDDQYAPKTAIVTYANGSYTYIKDDYGSLLLYGSGLEFKQGDKVILEVSTSIPPQYMGVYGTLKTYNGLLELAVNKDEVEFSVVSSDNPVEPKTITVAELNQSNMNEYLRIENAEFVEANGKNLTFKVGDETLAVYNQWNIKIDDEENGLKTGTKYTLTGMGCIYFKNETLTNQLYLTNFEEAVDEVAIKDVKLTFSMNDQELTQSLPASDWQNMVVDENIKSLKIKRVTVETSKSMKSVGLVAGMFMGGEPVVLSDDAAIDFVNVGNGVWMIDLGEGVEIIQPIDYDGASGGITLNFVFYICAKDEAGNTIYYNNGGENYMVTITPRVDDPNAIEDVKAESRKSGTYNLSGQPVTRTYRGVTIQNARKVFRK